MTTTFTDEIAAEIGALRMLAGQLVQLLDELAPDATQRMLLTARQVWLNARGGEGRGPAVATHFLEMVEDAIGDDDNLVSLPD